MEIHDVDALLDRHRDRFRRLLRAIAAEEAGSDPFGLPLEQFRAMSDDERASLIRRAAVIAQDRIERELRERRAAWLVLVGDDVVVASPDPSQIPSPDEVLRLGEPRGLVAYLFEAPLIEEIPPSVSAWSHLRGSDRYPTVPLVLNPGGPARAVPLADLDTGSHATLVDALLIDTTAATWFTGRHLGESFLWTIAAVEIDVATSSTKSVRKKFPLRVVRDWKTSPFTRINPDRRALVGRDFLRAFSLSVVLRAATAETEVLDAREDGES
jgi:hypothetical protein